MKNIQIVNLNKSHDNPEAFINNIVNLTFSKKLNASDNISDMLLELNIKEIKTLKETIVNLQSDLNNKDLLSENQFLDFMDIEEMLNKVIVTKDIDLYNTAIIRIRKLEKDLNINIYNNTLNNIIEMNHTGMLEHINVTYLIQGASRSFLAQIIRHRLFSFVSASQHYMDYSDFADFVVPVEIEKQGTEMTKEYLEANKKSLLEYKDLIAKGIDPSVARQLLPNSMRNNLIVTGNLREWLNFMNLRLCNRNTSEIQYVAMLIKDDLLTYVPTIGSYMTPDCVKEGHCTQKHLCCGDIYSDEKCHDKYKILIKK